MLFFSEDIKPFVSDNPKWGTSFISLFPAIVAWN